MTQRTMTHDGVREPMLETVPEIGEYCDSCTARALLRMTLPAGGELLFCGHHANRHADGIRAAAARVRVADGFEWRGGAGAARG